MALRGSIIGGVKMKNLKYVTMILKEVEGKAKFIHYFHCQFSSFGSRL